MEQIMFDDRFETTLVKVEQWAKERKLDKADPAKQMLKLFEEGGELAAAIARNNMNDKVDAIGDIIVVLTVLGMQLNIDIAQAYRIAYEQIKGRNGQMVNGVFVKEEDVEFPVFVDGKAQRRQRALDAIAIMHKHSITYNDAERYSKKCGKFLSASIISQWATVPDKVPSVAKVELLEKLLERMVPHG